MLPFLTSRRVLYLSLPCFTFSLWILSIVVSALKGQSHVQIHKHTCKYGQKLNEKPNYLYLIISGVGEVFLQASQLALQSFILLSKGETLLKILWWSKNVKREQPLGKYTKEEQTCNLPRSDYLGDDIRDTTKCQQFSCRMSGQLDSSTYL